MTTNEVFIYGGILLSLTLVSIVINRLFLKFSRNLGVRNKGDLLRWSKSEKPSVGGISFYISFLVVMIVGLLLPLDYTLDLSRLELFGLFASCTLGFLVGLADDAYNTNPSLKFLGQFMCAAILILCGIYIHITPLTWINYLFTIIWVVGIMNSVNMLDNMDGITASVSVAVILSILVVIWQGNNDQKMVFMAVILMGLVGGLVGFLYMNWHPAKIYMGDTGSQFLGIFLAVVSIFYLWHKPEPVKEYFEIRQFLLPLMAFCMPLIDTMTVFIRRIARGQSPFVGGRDHTTHHLAYNGLKDDQVAWVFAFLAIIGIGWVYFLNGKMIENQWEYKYAVIAITYFVLLFFVFQLLYERGKRKQKQMINHD